MPSDFVRWCFLLILCGFVNSQPFHLVSSSVLENDLVLSLLAVRLAVSLAVRKSPEIMTFPGCVRCYCFADWRSDRNGHAPHGLNLAVFHDVGVQIQGNLDVAVSQDL